MSHSVRKYIIAGLLVWLPLAITIWVLLWLLGLMDGVFSWLLTIGQHVLPAGRRRHDRERCAACPSWAWW